VSVPPTAPPVTGPQCPACASPLADDQRYCLACGELRPGARRTLPARLRKAPATTVVAAPDPAPMSRLGLAPTPSLTTGLAALACLLLAMGVGVLIGRGGGEQAATPEPITIAGAAASASSPGVAPATVPASFTSDWPDGKDGWTIALQSLRKDGTDAAAVAAAKKAATDNGVPAVGALDSTDHPTLTAGSYVVYSGVFSTRDLAGDALGKVRASFADAAIVQVATTAPSESAGSASPSKQATTTTDKPASTGNAFEESKKAPKTVGTGGKPPPKDDKPAAGGGGFQDIG